MKGNTWHRSEWIKNYTEVAAIFLAGLWAAYTFFFQSDYAQSRLKPHLIVQPTLEVIGRDEDGLVAVKGRVLVRNQSKARVELLGSWFNVFGYKVLDQAKPTSTDKSMQDLRDHEGTFLDLPTLAGKSAGEVVNRGRLLPARWHYEPDEETVTEFVTFVPGSFDLVELRANFILSKETADSFVVDWVFKEGGRLDFEHKYAEGEMPEGAYTYTYGIAHTSLWPETRTPQE